MTTWRSGSRYGRLCQEITNENDTHIICAVWVEQFSLDSRKTEPWPKGEANFRLILQAPRMMEALEAIVALRMPGWCDLAGTLVVYHQQKEIARAAIAAVEGENDGDEKVELA